MGLLLLSRARDWRVAHTWNEEEIRIDGLSQKHHIQKLWKLDKYAYHHTMKHPHDVRVKSLGQTNVVGPAAVSFKYFKY